MKQIIGPHLLEISSFKVDTQQAADLVVLTSGNITIGCRLRRPGYFERYPNDITIRSARDSGAKTELSKIVDGWGTWIFYGHLDRDDIIHRWFIIDLTRFRAGLIRDQGRIGLQNKKNGDGTHFVYFDITRCPELLVSSSEMVEELVAV
jgi:hypothetical protein